MKENSQLRMLAIVILVVFAVIDAFPFTPVTAIGMIVIILFKPKWFLRLVERIYE